MSKIFDSIVDVENYLGVPVAIPSGIPDDCNVLCYSETTGKTPSFYKECHNSLHYIDGFSGVSWKSTRKTLEQEVVWDNYYGHDLAYLRLATKDNSDVFTLERLLGVETNTGFIISVEERFYMGYQARVTTTNGFSYFMETLDYYISDDSDETVSFEEYVRTFYEG